MNKRGQAEVAIFAVLGAFVAGMILLMLYNTNLNIRAAECTPSYEKVYDCAQDHDCIIKQTTLNGAFKYSNSGFSSDGQYAYSYNMLAGWIPCKKKYEITFGNFEIKKLAIPQKTGVQLQQGSSNALGKIVWHNNVQCESANVPVAADNIVSRVIQQQSPGWDPYSEKLGGDNLPGGFCYVPMPDADPFSSKYQQ